MGVYKRGDTWYISYFRNGKHVREAMGKNKAAAEAVLNRKKLAIRAGTYSDPEDIPRVSFDEACDDYLRRKADLRGQVTLKSTVKTLRAHFAGKCLADLTEKDVDDFILSRRDSPTRHGRKRAGASINREVNVLRSLFRSAVKHGMVEKNPASCPRKFPERKRLRYLTEEEAASLLDLAKNSRSKDAYHAILMTEGIRKALSSRPRRLGTDFIFWGRVQEIRHHTGMRECFVHLLQRAGIEDFTFHDLRHTFASHLAMAGVPLHTIGQLLGHKTPGMTMRYAHLAPGYLNTAVGSLPAWGTSTKLAQSAAEN
jgi:site-specific recombinase XerD